MSRTPKSRRVALVPGVTLFKPVGIPMRCLEEVRLSVDEAEAVRLKHVEHLEQQRGAEKMSVSRPTFQRVLASAHNKIAEALLSGKAIRIEGGHFEVSPIVFRCSNGHQWESPFEATVSRPPRFCPTCNTGSIEQVSPRGIVCSSYDGTAACCRRCSRVAGAASEKPGATA